MTPQMQREYATLVTSYRERWIPSMEQLTLRAVIEIPDSLFDPELSRPAQIKELAKNALEDHKEIYRKYFLDWKTLKVTSYAARHGGYYVAEISCNIRER